MQENLSSGFANNKGADQPVHQATYLGPNCLHRLSAGDACRQRVNDDLRVHLASLRTFSGALLNVTHLSKHGFKRFDSLQHLGMRSVP